MSHDIYEWCKIWRKTDFGVENDMRIMENFHQDTWKSQNWDLDVILLTEVENIWA